MIQTAEKIYNINSIANARFIYESYGFSSETIYQINHIENAQFLYKSADYMALEQSIDDVKSLIALNEGDWSKQNKYKSRLEDLEIQKNQFIEDVKNLFISISTLEKTESSNLLKKIKEHFETGEFREAGTLLKEGELKKEKTDSLLNLNTALERIENNAEKYILKARLTLTDLQLKD